MIHAEISNVLRVLHLHIIFPQPFSSAPFVGEDVEYFALFTDFFLHLVDEVFG